MKFLTLLRHGKSDWSMPYRSDYDRPLKARGRRDAPRMGDYLASLDLLPDLIVSSPARRARQTALLFAEALGYDNDIVWDEAIYCASGGELLAGLRRLPSAADHVVLVGHNPGFEELAARLIAADPYDPAWTVRLPTAAAAHIRLDVEGWREVQVGCGQLQWLMMPKTLAESGK